VAPVADSSCAPYLLPQARPHPSHSGWWSRTALLVQSRLWLAPAIKNKKMDPDSNVGRFSCPIEGVLDAVIGAPPMGGCAVPPHHNEGLPIFKVDGHSSHPLDESSTVVASRSQPLLSIMAPVAPLSNSQGGSSYGYNLPRDISVMLCVSPQTAGLAFGYIFLAINEHIHQDPLLAFFDNAGRAVHVLPCPDFEVFL
jgi:hypothetical protein